MANTRSALSINPTTYKITTRFSEEEAEYQIPNSSVYLRYLKIHLTIVRCEERGEA
jgi:hypothetical protein